MGRAHVLLAAVIAATWMDACFIFVDTDGLADGADEVVDAAPDRPADHSDVDAFKPQVDASMGVDSASKPDASKDAAIEAEAGPPIQFVSAAKVDPLFNVSAIDLPRPPGVTINDVIVIGLFTDVATTDVTTPAGYTKLKDLPIGSSDTHGWFYLRIVGASEPPKTTFVYSSSIETSAVALAYRNVNTASPVDVASYSTTQGTSYIAAGVTTTQPRTMLVGLFLADDTNGATWTAPAGTTQRAVTGICFGVDKPFPTSGATGPLIAVSDQNAGGQDALIALAPAN